MADIFISHSGRDNEVAAAIGERIKRERPTWSLFYDKDNIRAGQRWQERLREELTSCRVVLALLSRNWLGSPWCFTEAVTATFRGKDVVGIETEDLTNDDLVRAPPILHECQRVRLRDGDDRAWQQILEALDRSGLDPDDWFLIPPNVGPYPGLVAFDEKDACVFFGRKQEITEYLGILDTLRGPDRSQVLVISGASGSGKSSLLRAGLIPRLRRKQSWAVISPFEVAREPVRNLLDRLDGALTGFGLPTQDLDLGKPPDDPTILAQTLDEALRRLEQASSACVLLPLDQAEALLAGDRPAADPARLLLDALAQVLGRRTRHVVVATTIRTEFVPRLEAVFAGPEVRLLQAPLSAIGSLSEVIEKPADRFGIELEPGLSGRIVEDVRTADALPLLAYTLRVLNESGDRCLTVDEYRALGGVQGAIGAKLAAVLSDPEPTAQEIRSLRRAFTRYLIRVDEGAVEDKRLLRRVVPRASLPQPAGRVIGRLVDAGLLVTKNATIELAHERLINNWPNLPLAKWLDEDATDRWLLDRLRERVNDDSLSDGLLGQAEELLQRDLELAAEEPALSQLVQRSRDQRIQAKIQHERTHAQLLAMQARRATDEAYPDDIERGGALALESILLARKSNLPAEADAIETARSALIRLPLGVLVHGSWIRALAVLPDGRLASGGDDGEIKLWPKEGTGEPVVLSHGSRVWSLAVLADGRLVSGGKDGNIKIWPKPGTGELVVFSHGGEVRSLAALPDGRLVSGGGDGSIKIWPKPGNGKPVVLAQGSSPETLAGVQLAVMADGRLASSGRDYHKIKLWPKQGKGAPVVFRNDSDAVKALVALPDGRLAGASRNIKLWPKEGRGEPVDLSHGSYSLAVLADGRLASGGSDGNIKIWPKQGGGEPVILPHGGSVLSLAVLADGRLASGGSEGKVKLWPSEGMNEPVVFAHEDWVMSLAVLPDGRLASGGAGGNIKVWPQGSGEPLVLSHGREIWSMVVLADGRLVSADHPVALVNGEWMLWSEDDIKIWPKDGIGVPVFLSQGSFGLSLAALADGRLASGGDDGNIKIWPKQGVGEPVILSHGSEVWSLAALPDGRLASGGKDSKIKLWPKDGTGEPIILSHGGSVLSLAVLADGRLASGGSEGKVKLWPSEGTDEPVTLSHGSPVSSLAALPDGRLASGDTDGKIKLWLKAGTADNPLAWKPGLDPGSSERRSARQRRQRRQYQNLADRRRETGHRPLSSRRP